MAWGGKLSRCGAERGRPQFFLQSYHGRIEKWLRAGGQHEADDGREKEKEKDDKPHESELVLLEKPPELAPPRLPGSKGFFDGVHARAFHFRLNHSRILGSTTM